ncbi:uncharacterized protein LOC111709909 [Eurytemora carolleeae]|uniref:uncharacterized protein LOC111709909 n=1 Tax=Eurytemora carolleeae TaxID=1294199 RepID=UPI000C78ED01|nr:uncharacterized protein LOC111709909 [Eurytemora carolleeae]|eukprot:XP_023339622.1 uncharacterized protein LOC111709909 [Eurytemora affinis]
MRSLILCSLLLAVLPQAITARYGRVHVKDGMFYSKDDGRILMFRGINSVIKNFPWYDPKMLDPIRQKQLKDWGFNAVRLGMMWSGLEPSEGEVNETYSGLIKDIVNGLEENGIYTYLDMHQDTLTGIDGYWGIPKWLSDKLDKSDRPYPWPMLSTSGFTTWACGYFTEEISNAFQQLYTNNKGAADYFANFWLQVTKRFMNNTAVLGYELINEPWTGDIYMDPSLLLPGNAGKELLEPFFNKASDAIRSLDNETMIFWEPVTYAYFVNSGPNSLLDLVLDAYLNTHNISIFFPILKQACGELDESFLSQDSTFINWFESIAQRFSEMRNIKVEGPSLLGPGFSAPPGGMEYLDRTVLSWHYYCWAIGYGGDEDFDPVLREGCDKILGPAVFNTVQERAKELGGSATFLTEFGTCKPNATLTNSTGTIECNFVLDQADLHLQSWSFWDTAGGGLLWDSNGEPILDAVIVFTRPYPQATAGVPLSLEFEHVTREFVFKYKPDLTIMKPTEIYVPPLVYNQGYLVGVPDGVHWEADLENKIHVYSLTNDDVTVTISPLL